MTLQKLCGTFAAALLAFHAHSAVITAEFDAFSNGGSWLIQPFYGEYVIGQTFKAEASGTLHSVETTIHRAAATSQALRVEIRALRDAGPNGVQPDMRPGAPVFASGVMLAGDPQFDTFLITFKSITMSPMAIHAGESYGLVITAPGTAEAYHWYTQSGGAGYDDGRLFVGGTGDSVLAGQSGDVAFRINVAPAPGRPEFDPYSPAGGSGVQQPVWNNWVLAQTFTNLIAGTLESVEATIHRAQSTAVPLRFEVREVYDAGGDGLQPDLRPGAIPLSAGEIPSTDPQFDTWMITYKRAAMSAVKLVAGRPYAMVVSASGSDSAYSWYTTAFGPSYEGGRFLRAQNGTLPMEPLVFDAGFRVNVTQDAFPSGLAKPELLSFGAVKLAFTNAPGLNITLLGSTNASGLPSAWTPLGLATEKTTGVYEFMDSTAPDYAARFYRFRVP
jgi:hypothetical protein